MKKWMQGISSSGGPQIGKGNRQADIPPLRGFKMQKTARCPRSIFALLFSDNLFLESSANIPPLWGFEMQKTARCPRSIFALLFQTRYNQQFVWACMMNAGGPNIKCKKIN